MTGSGPLCSKTKRVYVLAETTEGYKPGGSDEYNRVLHLIDITGKIRFWYTAPVRFCTPCHRNQSDTKTTSVGIYR